jgi:heme oxygenase
MKRILLILQVLLFVQTLSFSPVSNSRSWRTKSFTRLHQSMATGTFIETELRGAAMKLHTTQQAPKEGGVVEEAPKEPYVPNRDDYLAFLVDSKHVYEAMEEIVNEKEELAQFRNTGLERTKALEQDIQFMVKEYGLKCPPVGACGKHYAEQLRSMKSIQEFMCHYYNFYFAHTAGGRMIGKQMSALLLDKKTLEFYKVSTIPGVKCCHFSYESSPAVSCLTKWDGDLNQIKARVKDDIEKMVAKWSREEKDECVAATASAFQYGGGINTYLTKGKNSS